jgi:peptide/nickel transport system permease protein
LRRILHDPLGSLGLLIVVLTLLSAIFANWIIVKDPYAVDIKSQLLSPSSIALLGTDHLGRDVFSRVIMGGRIALGVALVSISIALSIGLVLGLLAGYGPQWLDKFMISVFDTIRSFPTIMFALAVVALVGPSLYTVILVVVITSIPMYGRVARVQAQSLRNAEYILAERAMGASTLRVLVIHMLPNVIGPLLIIASMEIPVVVTIEAGLSFLGLGVRPPTPSWGSILYDGYSYIRNTPWLVVAGGIPLILTTIGFTFLGETLRDVFDPKLRKDL